MTAPDPLPQDVSPKDASPKDLAPKDLAPKDPAKARFAAITLIRMSGAVLVLLGLLITERRIDLPWWLGLILTLFGLFDVFAMPTILARKWKSPS